MRLTDSERTRYSRHLLLPEVGIAGQERLKGSSVLVIGAGGLGSPVSMYLAAAGVGTLGVVDHDTIDLSNLQRQIVHSTEDIGSSKCASTKARLHQINPEIEVILYEELFCAQNALSLVGRYDVVVDATDNFSTRYLINDTCVLAKKPNVYGAIYRFEGQATVFTPGGPCYRCLFPDPPAPDSVPNCAEGGVLGVLAGLIGTVQATETIKLLLGLGTTLAGRLLLYDALDLRFDTLTIHRDKNCPVCGHNPSIKTPKEISVVCSTPLSGNGSELAEISPLELSARMRKGDRPFLLDVRNPEEHQLCCLKNSSLMPLRELSERMKELDREIEIVVYCKSGARSRQAVDLLLANGFSKIKNLRGGILAWIHDVDQSMQGY